MSLKYQFQFIQAMRNHFNSKGFLDVLTPPVTENPGMETHIHPFELYSINSGKRTNKFLHTSPEFFMKELLAKEEFDNIFTINYCFRDEPKSPIHRPQFLMCEWYRKNEQYGVIKDDVIDLVTDLSKKSRELGLPVKESFNKSDFQKTTVSELFQSILKIQILDFLETKELKKLIEKDFKNVPLPISDCSWDDYFFLLLLNEIEPVIAKEKAIFIDEYPAPLAALSTLKPSDARVCQRFELYIRGVEIANCFNELTNFKTQKDRFSFQAKEKKEIYNYSLPNPKRFLKVIENGYPSSSGIALGIERLFASLIETDSIFFD